MKQNKGTIRGTFDGGILQFCNETETEVFYKGTLIVRRFSGTEDQVPVVIPGNLVDTLEFGEQEVVLTGSFRSRNVHSDGKSSLQLYFFVEEFCLADDDIQNTLYLEGFVCKDPVYRLTPLDREICDLFLAVPRNTRKSDYIPCVIWGRSANWAKNLNKGDKVSISGRIQSRKFSKQGDLEPNSRTAYEVSVYRISKIEESEQN